jgi:hypothetical protein
MPSGLTTAWGDSPQVIAGMNNRLFSGNIPLTYNSSLISVQPTFKGDSMVSPLSLANQGYYTVPSFGKKKPRHKKTKVKDTDNSFGKSKKCPEKKRRKTRPVNRETCSRFLENGGTINPSTGRLLKKEGPVYKSIMRRCEKYNLIGPVQQPFYQQQPVQRLTRSASAQTYLEPVNNVPSLSELRVSTPKIIKRGNVELNVSVDPHYIKIGNALFTKGVDNAKYDTDGNLGKIVGIGPKVVLISPVNESKLKRPTINDFVRFNTV